MDNRYGDFRLPATDKLIGAEARRFRHAIEPGDAAAWRTAGFDDSGWEEVTHGFGPQFWLLGPLPAEAPEAALAQLARMDHKHRSRPSRREARRPGLDTTTTRTWP
jgi:hypothetical protein